jgi:hypothetical protein
MIGTPRIKYLKAWRPSSIGHITRPAWYVPYAQLDNTLPLNLVVSSGGDPATLASALRDAIRSVDPRSSRSSASRRYKPTSPVFW